MFSLKRILLTAVLALTVARPGPETAQSVEDYLRFFRSPASSRDRVSTERVLQEMDRFLLAYGISPSVP